MKVSELIAELQEVDGNCQVILSSDAGGNKHSPLSSIWEGVYLPDSTWSGEVYEEDEILEEIKEGYLEENAINKGQKAIIFTPLN